LCIAGNVRNFPLIVAINRLPSTTVLRAEVSEITFARTSGDWAYHELLQIAAGGRRTFFRGGFTGSFREIPA
jgi:hypothetical protein